MRHYVPPGAGPVTAVLGWRGPEGAESLAATLELADHVLAADDTTAREVHDADPAVDVHTLAELVSAVAPSPAPAGDEVLVCGVGPGDWRGAPDLWLRVAAALPETVGERPIRFAWLGLDPTDGRSYPYLYDAEHLGLVGRVDWCHAPAEAIDALGRCSAVVVTGRASFEFPVHAFVDAVGADAYLRALGVPIVGFDTGALDGLGGSAVPYPDVAALADRVLERLADAQCPDADRLVDAVLPRDLP
jgi:glycosyltransferase involved in cell wall biosynthesis